MSVISEIVIAENRAKRNCLNNPTEYFSLQVLMFQTLSGENDLFLGRMITILVHGISSFGSLLINRNLKPHSGCDRGSQPYRHAVGMSKWLVLYGGENVPAFR